MRAQNRTALIPYLTAGDPTPGATVGLMHALVGGGADAIELGVPFSDPMADGPVIAAAHERALRHQVGLRHILDMVQEFRQMDKKTPVILMGYQNPIEAMGIANFAQRAQAAGVDGVLTVDLPPEEAHGTAKMYAKANIDPIFLIAPTTPINRIKIIAELASGFVYYVSLKGVTGAQNLDTQALAARLHDIRHECALPVGVGFGIRDARTAQAVGHEADAVIIGSALVQIIAEFGAGDAAPLQQKVQAFMAEIRHALDTQ
ncbi:MAG: tryptophan synthase subunit alpha [Halothiobacillus sp. 28-55-5]|nr:MAG: tryptophan synthase subunit alpha [Halothiobacillus sp. 28-55-5]